MKLEKITDNKIRIILNIDELEEAHSSIEMVMSNSFQNQSFFLSILNKAEKELDFNTDNCKLLIEAFSNIDDFLIFTITKFQEQEGLNNKKNNRIKKPIIRKKLDQTENLIYAFSSFDTFCDFTSYINNSPKINISNLAKNIKLYYYKNNYYIIILGIQDEKAFKNINFRISEFGKNIPFSSQFSAKINEHGKLIMKHNALKIANKYF